MRLAADCVGLPSRGDMVVQSASSSCDSVDSLRVFRFPPTVQRYACLDNWIN